MLQLERVKKISTLLDSQFEGPFGIKFGLDPIVGLVPVVGDALTSLASFYVVIESYYMGCSSAVLLRMAFNIFLEDFIKIVPGVGVIFDFYWKSNLKNISLLEKALADPAGTKKSSTSFLIFLCFLFLGAFVLIFFISIAVLVWLAGLLSK